jgi:type 1 fimbria pilin
MQVMKKLLAATLVASMVGACASAFAATSATVNVTGIITPDACTISVDTTSVDFGVIAPGKLNTDAVTHLDGNKRFDVNVDCASKARAYVRFIESRRGSALDAYPGETIPRQDNTFGLGMHGVDKIGGYVIHGADVGPANGNQWLVDGIARQRIYSADAGATWAPIADGTSHPSHYVLGHAVTAAEGARGTPVGFMRMRSSYNLDAYIAPGKDLSLTEDIQLDGQFTVELHMI